MKDSTIKKWKRDALEVKFDWTADAGPEGKLIRKMADRVAELAYELESRKITFPRTTDDMK